MKEYFALAVALIWFFGHVFYLRQIIRKNIFPTLSTWIIFSVATGLNMASYLVASNKDLVSGSIIITDALVCFLIVVAVAIFTYSGLRFKPFEKYYLISAMGIVVFWAMTGNAFVANLLVQALIVVGYAPTIQNLIYSTKNPETYVTWSISLGAAILSLYPIIANGNLLASIYSIRAIIMISFVIYLMLRIKRKNIIHVAV